MTHDISRRQFLRSAGGMTFLALSPVGRGLFAFADSRASVPLFTALPYVQPGPDGKFSTGGEAVRLAWQTEKTPAEFVVKFGPGKKYEGVADVARTERWSGDDADGEGRYNYVSTLGGLKLGTRYGYEVTCNGKKIAEGYFTTRVGRGQKIRFAAFGDNSFGDISDRAIAYHAYKSNPDFVMNTGDNVYDGGLDNEYARYFFPVYNADVAGDRLGAPLLRSVPFYTVIANHDVHRKDAGGNPVADFDKDPDALAYYTNMHMPLNGPSPSAPTNITGKAERLERFKQAAGARFPNMANYSYDWGDVHFLCLDSNIYVDPTDANLQNWIEKDLTETGAAWKFVVHHHPATTSASSIIRNSTCAHCRRCSRSTAWIFVCTATSIPNSGQCRSNSRLAICPKRRAVNAKDRRVPGTFTIDRNFDGKTKTKPDGIFYITTGAGGKHLYDPGFTSDPSKWVWPDDNNVAYVARFVSDRHSLTIFDVEKNALTMRQIDENGNEIDRITVTKARDVS